MQSVISFPQNQRWKVEMVDIQHLHLQMIFISRKTTFFFWLNYIIYPDICWSGKTSHTTELGCYLQHKCLYHCLHFNKYLYCSKKEWTQVLCKHANTWVFNTFVFGFHFPFKSIKRQLPDNYFDNCFIVSVFFQAKSSTFAGSEMLGFAAFHCHW